MEWWENSTLHQQSSLTDGNLEDLTLFTWFLGTLIFALAYVWLMIHRFRVGWLSSEHEALGYGAAIEERKAEAGIDSEAQAQASEDGGPQ